ncbi:TPA: GNAT family N-acetyltransferase, partial [Vibrio parahaemolyticus]
IGVHDQFHGLGVGSKLIETIIELADNWLNVRRIQLEVNADNEAAIGLYKKHGFEIEGEAIDASFRDGEFINTYYMARIRPSKK